MKKQLITTYVSFGIILIGMAMVTLGVRSIDVTWLFPAGIIAAILIYKFKDKPKDKEKEGTEK